MQSLGASESDHLASSSATPFDGRFRSFLRLFPSVVFFFICVSVDSGRAHYITNMYTPLDMQQSNTPWERKKLLKAQSQFKGDPEMMKIADTTAAVSSRWQAAQISPHFHFPFSFCSSASFQAKKFDRLLLFFPWIRALSLSLFLPVWYNNVQVRFASSNLPSIIVALFSVIVGGTVCACFRLTSTYFLIFFIYYICARGGALITHRTRGCTVKKPVEDRQICQLGEMTESDEAWLSLRESVFDSRQRWWL